MYGNNGTFTKSAYSQKDATTFVESKQYGSGGTPVGLMTDIPAIGDFVVYENGTNTITFTGTNSFLYGAGGAAGYGGGGWNGANGMVIFWWN